MNRRKEGRRIKGGKEDKKEERRIKGGKEDKKEERRIKGREENKRKRGNYVAVFSVNQAMAWFTLNTNPILNKYKWIYKYKWI